MLGDDDGQKGKMDGQTIEHGDEKNMNHAIAKREREKKE